MPGLHQPRWASEVGQRWDLLTLTGEPGPEHSEGFMEIAAFSRALVEGKILNLPCSCGLGVRSHGAEGDHKEIHQEPVAVSWQEWPGQEGGRGPGDGGWLWEFRR